MSLAELTKIAEQYLQAHNKELATFMKGSHIERKEKPENMQQEAKDKLQCFNCNGFGHKAADCNWKGGTKLKSERLCFLCSRPGHLARDCKRGSSPNENTHKAGAAYSVDKQDEDIDVESCIEDNQLLSKNGKKLPIIKIGGSLMGTKDNKMPVVKGWIGDTAVETLRHTGCSGIVVKKNFVRHDQYTGKTATYF